MARASSFISCVARAARGERDTRHARQMHAVVVAAKLLAAAECACMCMLLLDREATFEAIEHEHVEVLQSKDLLPAAAGRSWVRRLG